MEQLTVGSLFSGIGGLDLGLERAGMRVVWQCEIDPACREVHAGHWPSIRRFQDVGQLVGNELPPVEVLAGGFPCQDVSHAGRRAGIEGKQSGLWAHFARLIRELRPSFVLVENVPGLLSGGMGTVLADLAASGYDAEWDCIPAAAVGAAHLRTRVWLLAYPCGFRDEADHTVFAGRNESDLRPWWPAEPYLGRVADGFPSWMVERLGNAVVPQVAEWVGRQIVAYHATQVEAGTRR